MSLGRMINQTNSQDIFLHDGLSYVDLLPNPSEGLMEINCCATIDLGPGRAS